MDVLFVHIRAMAVMAVAPESLSVISDDDQQRRSFQVPLPEEAHEFRDDKVVVTQGIQVPIEAMILDPEVDRDRTAKVGVMRHHGPEDREEGALRSLVDPEPERVRGAFVVNPVEKRPIRVAADQDRAVTGKGAIVPDDVESPVREKRLHVAEADVGRAEERRPITQPLQLRAQGGEGNRGTRLDQILPDDGGIDREQQRDQRGGRRRSLGVNVLEDRHMWSKCLERGRDGIAAAVGWKVLGRNRLENDDQNASDGDPSRRRGRGPSPRRWRRFEVLGPNPRGHAQERRAPVRADEGANEDDHRIHELVSVPGRSLHMRGPEPEVGQEKSRGGRREDSGIEAPKSELEATPRRSPKEKKRATIAAASNRDFQVNASRMAFLAS